MHWQTLWLSAVLIIGSVLTSLIKRIVEHEYPAIIDRYEGTPRFVPNTGRTWWVVITLATMFLIIADRSAPHPADAAPRLINLAVAFLTFLFWLMQQSRNLVYGPPYLPRSS